MTSQFLFVNTTGHKLVLERDKNMTVQKWRLHRRDEYSLGLPVQAKHWAEYLVKHDGVIVSKFWIDHLGSVRRIRNLTHSFWVATSEIRHGHDYIFESSELPSIYILDRHTRHHYL
uniref:Uncharacterized protein n=1 Tax=viral metagenome TaxID=1070528 RepID=A0A6C0BMQ6_9ZZZZ